MTLLKTTITATSNFATPLQGDTLFGQICWMIRYCFGKERLKELLKAYETTPFLVVSDGFATGYLPKPTLPSRLLGEDGTMKKENRKKIWLTLEALQKSNYTQAKTNDEVSHKVVSDRVVKNSLDYRTFTTGEGFDPYSEEEYRFENRDIYFLLDEEFLSREELEKLLMLIGEVGYGKNRTIGKGRFTLTSLEKVTLATQATTTYMLLSSLNAEGIEAKSFFYEPLTKFGKHGGDLATHSPFKKPLLLAKCGSVVVFETPQSVAYLGSAIHGHSVHKETVHQGYAIALPIAEVVV